jgi:hypothetical protein
MLPTGSAPGKIWFHGRKFAARERPDFIYAMAMRDNCWAAKLLRKLVTLE